MIFTIRNDNPPKLAFVPDWSWNNPYQKLLYDEMEVGGIACYGLQGKDFTFVWILKNIRKFKFIHLHWLLGIYHWQKKGLCWSILFILLMKILLSRLVGYKVLWTVHNIVAHETTNYNLEIIMRKIVARLVNNVIVHCEYARSTIIKSWGIPAGKVTAIPHGSYIGHYANDVSRNRARQQLHIGDHEFTFLFFGLLRTYKGVKELLSSFSELKKSQYDIHLIIAGNPQNDILKKEIEDMAAGDGISLYLRYIEDNEVQVFFNACDIVVLPYLNILTSGAAVLALSFGRPVIAPDKGCIPELLNETMAFLYHNQNELTAAMASAATNKNIPVMSNNALEKAEQLRWRKIVADYYFPILQKEKRNSLQ